MQRAAALTAAPTAREEAEGAAFERFAASAAVQLRRVLVAQHGVELGRDLTADAMSYAWAHWDRVSGMDNPLGYLYRVAQSSARRYRRWGRQPVFPPEQRDQEPMVEPGLGVALGKLSEPQRVAVLLVHAHGWTYAETAAVLDVSVDAVRNHLHRGMAKLRRLLEVDDAR